MAEGNGARKAILVRLPPEMYERLTTIAKREHRTYTAEINVAVEHHVERVEREAETTGAKS